MERETLNNQRVYLPDIVGKGYKEFWNCKKRYRVVKGSRGSKKSKTTALWYIYNLMRYPQANLLVIRRTGSTLKDSCFSDLEWATYRLQVSHLWKFVKAPLEAEYIPTGQKILFRGLDDPLKITSISVPKGVLCWAWFEEAYEVTREDDFNKVDLSIRGEMPDTLFKQITLTFNPWSSLSWLKTKFFDAPDEDTLAITTTWHCNEWLDDADKQVFEKMKEQNPRRYRIEGEGEWGLTEGLIYNNFKMKSFDIDEVRRKEGANATFGLDFGYTDPNAFVCAIINNREMKIYIFDEWFKTGVTNKDIARQIIAMGYGGQRIVCDSAEPKSIAELRDEGINAEPSRKGKDSVLFGIQQIQNYEIVIHPRCVEVWKEINNYCWGKDKFGKSTDRPEHEFSHGMDALRYGTSKALVGDLFSFS